jgi:hypothetical protein
MAKCFFSFMKDTIPLALFELLPIMAQREIDDDSLRRFLRRQVAGQEY